MATAIGDLLDVTSRSVSAAAPDEAGADAAIAAIGHLARALSRLDDPTGIGSSRRQLAVRELAHACRAAAAQFPPAPSRSLETAAAAADSVGLLAPRLTPDERWAAATQVAQVVERAAAVATGFAPYADVPALRRIQRVSEVIRQIAVIDPPDDAMYAVLDAPIPAVASARAGLPNAVADLLTRVDRSITDGEFTVAAALTISAAAESAVHHAAVLAAILAGQRPGASRWTRVTDSWRVLQETLRQFDDGSRYSTPSSSALTQSALALHDRVQNAAAAVRPTPRDHATSATELRYVANHVPALGAHIDLALARWSTSGRLFARAHSLPFAEERVADLLHDRAVLVRPPEITQARRVARTAHRLSAALAVDLDRSAGVVGHQPQPHLVRALRAALAVDSGRQPRPMTAPDLRVAPRDFGAALQPY